MGRAARIIGPALLLYVELAALSASAQNQGLVVRDGTLGNAPAGVVTPGPDDIGQADYLIRADLGEQRGRNLFHSFERFSIGSGERATFTDAGAPNPGAIENVISRVTGDQRSEIHGTLHSTIPGADVWLLNPNGVMFGAGAQLDVPGTFHASTADSLGFGADGLERFYSDPSRQSVLSTATPLAFGFLSEGGAALLSLEGGLAVTRGEALLAGGDVSLTDALLSAPGAHLSLEAPGTVELSRSTVDAGGEAPGKVSIRAGRLVLQGGNVAGEKTSGLLAENTGAGLGGSIAVEASESVLVDNGLLSVRTTGAGNAGTIDVASPSVTFRNGLGTLAPNHPDVGAAAETFGVGKAGTIHIAAQELTIQHGAALSAFAFGGNVGEASGDAGTIEIDANTLKLSDRSFIGVAALGNATNAGTIDIDLGKGGHLHAYGEAHADGEFGYAWIVAGTFSQGTPFTPTGKGGDIAISTGSLLIENGAQINVSTQGDGDAGSIAIHSADSVTISNGALIGAVTAGDGHGGTIAIDADSVLVREGGSISAGTTGAGPGGTLAIEANSVRVSDRGIINTSTSGSGAAGAITIGNGTGLLEITGGNIQASTRGSGNGGLITVDVDEVKIGVEGFIAAITTSNNQGGDAGSIRVQADSILMSNKGGSPFSLLRILTGMASNQATGATGIFSGTIGGGNGGEITLAAHEIRIEEGAFASTATVGGGDAGKVELTGARIQVVNGGFIDSTSIPDLAGRPGGAAGSVQLVADGSIELVGRRNVILDGTPLEEWSHVSTTTLGSGTPGTVTLEAPRILVDGGAVVTAAVAAPGSAGGDIQLVTDELDIRHGGRIDASTFIDGPGGNIDVVARRSIVVEGEDSGISSRTGGDGRGGNISLSAPVIEVREGGEVSAKSERGLGAVGEILESLIVDGLLAEPSQAATGDAGSIELIATKLIHLDAGDITTASPHGAASGGNITIDPDFVILQNGSHIVATADTGHGGAIRITADNYFAFPGSVVSAASGISELSGSVEVHAPDVNLAGQVTPLPASFLDASSLMRERCAARARGEVAGSFAVRGNGGIPPEPDGWLRASVIPDTEPTAAAEVPLPILAANLPGPFLAQGTCE